MVTRIPYVGSGADGARRSAEIDRSERLRTATGWPSSPSNDPVPEGDTMKRTLLVLPVAALAAACSPLAVPVASTSTPSAPSCPTVTPRVNGTTHTGDVLLDCNGARVSVQSFLDVQDPGESYANLGDGRRFDGLSPSSPASVTPLRYSCGTSPYGGRSTMWVHTEVVYTGPTVPHGFDIVRDSPKVSGGSCY